jgi:hypothetical protein
MADVGGYVLQDAMYNVSGAVAGCSGNTCLDTEALHDAIVTACPVLIHCLHSQPLPVLTDNGYVFNSNPAAVYPANDQPNYYQYFFGGVGMVYNSYTP